MENSTQRRTIYADHNATTPLGPAARKAMIEALDAWGNPSSSHGIGRQARELLEKARAQVASSCGVDTKDVVFTSGGSEANAQAILGMHFGVEGLRVVTAETEHSSVRDAIAFLEKRGATVYRAPVLPSGQVDTGVLEALIREHRPHLVSLMAANNETGVVLDLEKVSALCQEFEAAFHCDCVQAFGKIPRELWNRADLITISSHKIYGPKGVGALIVRGGRKLVPLPFGGTQEVKRRGGTQNMMGIIGFGAACEELAPQSESLRPLQQRFEKALEEGLTGVSVNGSTAPRVANTSNVRISGLVSEVMLSILDLSGVCVSAGSACSSGSISPSPVLLAMGLDKNQARECLRFSWGRDTSPQDIDTVAGLVIEHVNRIRARNTR
ncbi:cysteine desulfurase [bacterium]|nr:cysteine desulfurase [bacterium]